MELKLVNGDYVPNSPGSGFDTVNNLEEIIQRIMFRLTVPRGSFPLIPQLGSNLRRLYREKKSNRASAAYQYVREALADEAQVRVGNVSVSEADEKLIMEVDLSISGEDASIVVEI
ncbi:MAG: hypothetical protein E7456_01490 [Ruminococcaceae bacterium]|nr:hypothetical protein [Oscillospiraceae bacterium]